jgi:hypothetical protein
MFKSNFLPITPWINDKLVLIYNSGVVLFVGENEMIMGRGC